MQYHIRCETCETSVALPSTLSKMFRLLLCFAAFILSEDSETGSGDAVEESKEDEKMIINLEEVAMSVPMVPHHWKSSRHRF